MIQYIILFSIKCINIATTLRGDMAKVLSSEKKILVTVTVRQLPLHANVLNNANIQQLSV